METLLRQYFWIVNILLVMGTGYAVARATSSYVEHEVLKVPLVEEKAAEETDAEEEAGFGRTAINRSVDLERRRALLRPAAAEQAPVEAPTEAAAEALPAEETPPPEEPAGELSMEFIAAITTSDQSKNLALVRVDGGATMWVGVGMEVKPGFQVAEIANYYIRVTQGVTELLWKKKEAEPPKPALAAAGRPGTPPDRGAAAASAEPKPAPAAAKTPYTEGVKQTGPFEYNIDRAMLNEQLQDLAKLGREARVIPNYDRDSGSYKGFKLIGVRPNSLYRAIGIRSGDVIMQINGEELNSPGKALELFTKLQNSSGISLDIMRRGQKQSLTYKIE